MKKAIQYVGYKWVLPLLYKWYAMKPVDENLVVFADHRDRDMSDGLLANASLLYDICKKNSYRCVVMSGKLFGKSVPIWKRRKERLKFIFQFIKFFARCRALFLVDYFPPAYVVTPRTGTDVIQLWHACGAMKLFGFSTDEKDWGLSQKEKRRYHIHENYTLASVSGPKALEPFREAFHCQPNAVQALGVPRTDVFFNEQFKKNVRQKVRLMFPKIGNKKIILYAPTYRGRSISESYINCDLNYSVLKDELSDQYIFLTKFHPLMAKSGSCESDRIQGTGFAFDVSKELSAEEALCAADILITDYSSIMFEFLLLERPIISYIYDIDDYIRDRGLYYPYEQLAPGPYVFTQEELIEKLKTVSEWFDVKEIQKRKDDFMSACDGHSTERIYQHVFGPAKHDAKEAETK